MNEYQKHALSHDQLATLLRERGYSETDFEILWPSYAHLTAVIDQILSEELRVRWHAGTHRQLLTSPSLDAFIAGVVRGSFAVAERQEWKLRADLRDVPPYVGHEALAGIPAH